MEKEKIKSIYVKPKDRKGLRIVKKKNVKTGRLAKIINIFKRFYR